MKAGNNPPRPYYAVIFSSRKISQDEEYKRTAERMEELASEQAGYLGIESARNAEGFGITVSYWESLEAIRNWKQNTEHLFAQEQGRKEWYSEYHVRVCELKYEYDFQSA